MTPQHRRKDTFRQGGVGSIITPLEWRVEGSVALTNEDIDERFEIDADGVVRWKRVSAKGLPRWCAAKAEEINRKAGEPVHFFPHQNGGMVVKLYGGTVSESRVRKVLQRETARDAGKDRMRSDKGRAKRAAAAPAPQAQAAKPWYDPSDPKPMNDPKALMSWLGREAARREAWQAEHGGDA